MILDALHRIVTHRESLSRADARVVMCEVLAGKCTDAQIAALLNEAGEVAGMGGAFTTSQVQWIRHAYAIETGCPERPSACPSGQRADGRYSAQAAADLLTVDVSTIAEWCKTGRLESMRSQPGGPRWIALTPKVIQQLRKPTRRQWSRPT